MQQIEGIYVNNSYIGTEVIYVPFQANGDVKHPSCEVGKIRDVTPSFVFVDYNGSVRATNARDLRFKK